MNIPISKILITMIVGISTYYFVFWLPMSLLFSEAGLLSNIGASFVTVCVCWYTWNHLDSNGLINSITTHALAIGAICFVLGFFGPIIFSPESNQGPLLGIFITGPLGFLVGGIVGLVRWIIRKKVKPNENS